MLGLVTAAVLALVPSSCQQNSFKGSGQTVRQPGTAPGLRNSTSGASTGGSTSGTDPRPGTTPNPDAPKCSLTIAYDSHESDDNSKWTGTYTYSFQRSGEQPVKVLSYNSGAGKSKVTVPATCVCGDKNQVDLIIDAGGISQDLAAWNDPVIASHSAPSRAPDWQDFLGWAKMSANPATVYLGGFDHEFLSSNWCGNVPFSCGSREWDNRDDSMVIFSCNIAECPGGGAGTELNFNGQDN
ncbi:MAG: hypothetical protein RIQ81_572 [Pseudomonadota bacterium]